MSNLTLQNRWKSIIFWIGMAGVVAQSVLGVLIACGVVDETISGAIIAGIAGIEAYCVANNPSVKEL